MKSISPQPGHVTVEKLLPRAQKAGQSPAPTGSCILASSRPYWKVIVPFVCIRPEVQLPFTRVLLILKAWKTKCPLPSMKTFALAGSHGAAFCASPTGPQYHSSSLFTLRFPWSKRHLVLSMVLFRGPLNSSLLLGTRFQVCALARPAPAKYKTRIARRKPLRKTKREFPQLIITILCSLRRGMIEALVPTVRHSSVEYRYSILSLEVSFFLPFFLCALSASAFKLFFATLDRRESRYDFNIRS